MSMRLILEYKSKDYETERLQSERPSHVALLQRQMFSNAIRCAINSNSNIDAYLHDWELVFAACEPADTEICSHDGKASAG